MNGNGGGNGSANGGNGGHSSNGTGGSNGTAGNNGAGGNGGSSRPTTPDQGPTKILPQSEIEQIAMDTAGWNARKAACDSGLDKLVGPDYVGWGWRTAGEQYGACYLVAKYLNLDPATVAAYGKKTIAIMKVLARHHPYGTPDPNQELVGVGNGSTKTFTLRMPMASGTMSAFVTPVTEVKVTYAGAMATLPAFAPIIKISDSSGGAANYVRGTDYQFSYYNELDWVGKHPAQGAIYYATVADQAFKAATGVSVSGTTLTFATAPAAGQAIFVVYMGPDYEQSGNYLGGVGSVRPDSGYAMRSVNVGLAEGYDAMRASTLLTGDLRVEFYTILNAQVDWYEAYVKINPYNDGELSNYFVRGHLTGTLFTAFATDEDNPRAKAGGDLKPLARTLLMRTYNSLDKYIPGGYGPEGSYDSSSNNDEFQLFSIWKTQQNEDLASQLAWTANWVPAQIHATKPDLTFYDGGDWGTLPAIPPITALQAFVKYQADHPMAPFARQLLADLGSPVAGPTASYKTGTGAFPLSYLAKGTGPLYARSDWGANATWVSLATGPIFEPGHEHYDRAHFSLQRGKDYLVINSGGYGITNTLPWHNTLGFDDRGAGDKIVYPPGQGKWGDPANVKAPKYLDKGTFVYGQEDFTGAYAGTDGTNSSVTRAVRSMVFVRPDIVVLHDQAQVANANVIKSFSVNINSATVTQAADTFSGVVGASRLFMRSLVPANPTPTILPPATLAKDSFGDTHPIIGSNYVVTTTGQKVDTFLHLFQMSASSQAQMDTSAYLKTADGQAQGVEVDMGARRWVVLFSVSAPQLGASLSYAPPLTCPCTHVIGDLPAMTAYQITAGAATQSASSDANGVLTFATDDAAATSVQITAK